MLGTYAVVLTTVSLVDGLGRCESRGTPRTAGTSGGLDGQGVLEDVTRVVLGLDALELTVVLLPVQRGPRYAGSVPGRVLEVHVGVVDEAAVLVVVGYRYAAGLGEDVAVEFAQPGHPGLVLARVGPPGGEPELEEAVPLGDGGGRGAHRVDLTPVGRHVQRAPALVVRGGQAAVQRRDLV